MPRGSSLDGTVASQQGGSGGSESSGSGSNVEMLGRTGTASNSGKYVIRKRYLVTDEANLTAVPTPPSGFRATSINYSAIGGGAYEQVVEFESFINPLQPGGAGGGSGGSTIVETLSGVSGRFELDVQDELVPISAHPDIQLLIKKYNGQVDASTGRVTFPPTYTPTGGSGLQGGGTGGPRTNPMAGKLYFTKPAATFRHIQQMQSIPGDIWTNVGKKVENLPAGFPNPPPFTNDAGEQIKYYWIVMSPQIYRRGESYEIIRSYKLSEPNAPDELYKLSTPQTSSTGGGVSG